MNKKILLLPIIGSFLLTGCKLNIFGKTIYLFEKAPEKEKEQNVVVISDDEEPGEMHQHATSLSYNSNSPSAPFYLKVGETREIGVSLSPAPDADSEKTVTWAIDKTGFVDYTVNASDTKKITITGVKVGTAKLTATNDYNKNLTHTFTVNVIDFDEESDFMWQYDSEDRKEFGYIYKERPEGIAEGDANLGGIVWHFTRSNTVTLQSSMGAVGFGRGTEPETHIHLETDNIRTIKGFVFEAASANSLAKMTIKVGDTLYMNEKTVPADYYDVIQTMYSDSDVTPSSGKIEIDVYTPEYDSKLDGTEGYKKPGAFYLKSIIIDYVTEETPVSTISYDFKSLYDNHDSDFYKAAEAGNGFTVSNDNYDLIFKALKVESKSVAGYATTNSDIELKLKKSNEVIYKVEAKFNNGTLSTPAKYKLEKSITGGVKYVSSGVSADGTGAIKVTFSEDHLNAIRFVQSGNWLGIESLTVLTVTGKVYTVDSIFVPENMEPTQKEYKYGDAFNPEGLNNLEIRFVDEGVSPVEILPTELTWYDGTSYDKNPKVLTTVLQSGTTKVYGVYNGEVLVTITGLTVADEVKNLTLVKSVSEINTTSQFYLVDRTNKKLMKGSGGGQSMGANSDKGQATLANAGENIQINALLRDDYYVFEASGEKYSVKSTTKTYFGMKIDNGEVKMQRNASPDCKDFTLTINPETFEATFKFEITGSTSGTGYLAIGSNGSIGVFATLDDTTTNLSIYKVVA